MLIFSHNNNTIMVVVNNKPFPGGKNPKFLTINSRNQDRNISDF